MGIVISGTGSYLPERVIDNHELESMTSDFDRARSGCTLDEWVTDHIGVSSRHRAAPGEGSGSMAAAAGRRALDDAGLDPADLDLVVLSTFTSDHRLPQSVRPTCRTRSAPPPSASSSMRPAPGSSTGWPWPAR